MAISENGTSSTGSGNVMNGAMTIEQVKGRTGCTRIDDPDMLKFGNINLSQEPHPQMINEEANSGLVCVTGGSGYIASSLIARLLQLGYIVRTTVRSLDESKISHLLNLEMAKERLTFYKAELTDEGSFDRAIDGVDGVFHCAAPVIPNDPNGDPEVTMIDPCVKGSINVLKACAKSNSVKKVVMTSSCAAIRYDYTGARRTWTIMLDEKDWSNEAYCREHKMWYALGKTKAEIAAWKFAKEHNINLITVNPSYVLGEFLGNVPTSTMSYMKLLLTGGLAEYPNQIIGFVHIQDVVTAHVLLYESSEAEGRYICSATVAHWNELLRAIRMRYPMLKKLPMRCKNDNHEVIHHDMSSKKLRKLGLTRFQNMNTMIEDCVEDFKRKGFLSEFFTPAPIDSAVSVTNSIAPIITSFSTTSSSVPPAINPSATQTLIDPGTGNVEKAFAT